MIFKNNNTFHLQGKNVSYIMVLNEKGDLLHYHFGKKISNRDYSLREDKFLFGSLPKDEDNIFLETKTQEYPAYGYTDLRSPAYTVRNRYGNSISRLLFKDYIIKNDSVAEIKGMPYVHKGNENAQTLEITLCDENIGLEVILSYTVFDEYDVILRNSIFINNSNEDLLVEKAYSTNVDFEDNNYDLIYFPGAWCREREFVKASVTPGEKKMISNARGGSGHAMNPFVIMCSKDADERNGEAYGFSLVYSGNHAFEAECDLYGNVRIKQGINPFEFEKKVAPSERFYTPQAIMSYSNNGLGKLSRGLHDLYRNNLYVGKWSGKARPILINNWEGTYFDFTEDMLVQMAKSAKEVGIELFVLDDGWFGKRDDDKSSLGDWYVNKEKLPSGIEGLADKINKEGLDFGLWFEPEMVNPDSELFRKHPDWIVCVPNMVPALGRNQYLLDLTNEDVCNHIIKVVSSVLESANIVYVKWDYNRVMTNMPYKGYNHQYTLGLYKLLSTLTTRFPYILFEGCAGGGGRFDPGMLAYHPQIWTSDNTDAVQRLKIQYSTSMGYPLSTMSAHVTVSPNHQVGRVTSLKTRADVAYAGIFGYELDIAKVSQDDKEEIKEQIEFYNKIKNLVISGDLYRLQSPYNSNYCSWQIVSKDKSKVFLFACRIMSQTNYKDNRLYLDGLDESKDYIDTSTGKIYGGDELMIKGIQPLYEKKDFATFIKVYEVV